MAEINTNGMAVAPSVIDTIVNLAVSEVPGVVSVGAPNTGLFSILTPRPMDQRVYVESCDDGTVAVTVPLHVKDGYSLNTIVSQVREAVAEAVLTQASMEVSRVDIRVDGIQFED